MNDASTSQPTSTSTSTGGDPKQSISIYGLKTDQTAGLDEFLQDLIPPSSASWVHGTRESCRFDPNVTKLVSIRKLDKSHNFSGADIVLLPSAERGKRFDRFLGVGDTEVTGCLVFHRPPEREGSQHQVTSLMPVQVTLPSMGTTDPIRVGSSAGEEPRDLTPSFPMQSHRLSELYCAWSWRSPRVERLADNTQSVTHTTGKTAAKRKRGHRGAPRTDSFSIHGLTSEGMVHTESLLGTLLPGMISERNRGWLPCRFDPAITDLRVISSVKDFPSSPTNLILLPSSATGASSGLSKSDALRIRGHLVDHQPPPTESARHILTVLPSAHVILEDNTAGSRKVIRVQTRPNSFAVTTQPTRDLLIERVALGSYYAWTWREPPEAGKDTDSNVDLDEMSQ